MIDFARQYLSEAIALFLGGFINFIFNRRKDKVSVATNEIDNGTSVVKLYKDALDDLPVRYQQKFEELNALFAQKEKILHEEIGFLKKERDLWKKKYNDLLKEHRLYRKEHP